MQKEDMEKKILEYIKGHDEPLDSEEDVLVWWQGLQEMTTSLDDLTEQLEYLEDQSVIEKKKGEKDLFVYRVIADK